MILSRKFGLTYVATHSRKTGNSMKYLHTMVRVTDIDASLDFYCNKLRLQELSRYESAAGRFTLVFLAAPGDESAQVELTYNWDPEVLDIYELCKHLLDSGVTINRPPRDGHMAFIRSPDGVSVELLQKGGALPPAAPWADMPNVGEW